MKRLRSAALCSRNFEMSGRRTSARLESPLWRAFDEICVDHGVNRAMLARMIDARRARGTGLTSALRIFLLSYYRSAARQDPQARTEEGLDHLIAALDIIGPVRDGDPASARLEITKDAEGVLIGAD